MVRITVVVGMMKNVIEKTYIDRKVYHVRLGLGLAAMIRVGEHLSASSTSTRTPAEYM